MSHTITVRHEIVKDRPVHDLLNAMLAADLVKSLSWFEARVREFGLETEVACDQGHLYCDAALAGESLAAAVVMIMTHAREAWARDASNGKALPARAYVRRAVDYYMDDVLDTYHWFADTQWDEEEV